MSRSPLRSAIGGLILAFLAVSAVYSGGFFGLGVGPATALLLTVPSTGLVTLGITRQDLGWRTPSLMLLATFAGGVVAGLAVGAL